MKAAVCTLFQGHYHYGLAALVNSLFTNEFKGEIYVGYRGNLPFWALAAKENYQLNWEYAKSYEPVEGLVLHFLPLETEYHLTNYKPDFMLRLWDGPAKDAAGMFYFDPDIVIKCKWKIYENWIQHGVALVHEIISNDMPPTHPLRREWQQVIKKANKSVVRDLYSYINGGFCGVSKINIGFIKDWKLIMKIGNEHFDLSFTKFMPGDRSHIFFASDQDALNITAMCSEHPLSEIGPESMDFIHGGTYMSHAVGAVKPWNKNFILSALKGHPPSLADKAYWRNIQYPIAPYNKNHVGLKKFGAKTASFIGRFYQRY